MGEQKIPSTDLEFMGRSLEPCRFREPQEDMVYCKRGFSLCKHLSRYTYPYVVDGKCGGREYLCMRRNEE